MQSRHLPLVVIILAVVLVVLCVSVSAIAAKPKPVTREDAQALCEKAAALIQSEGFEKAKAAFQDRSGQFFDRNLYVFAFDKTGKFVAHGTEPLLIGLNGYNLRDIHGTPLVREFLKVSDKGWVDYNWADPEDGHKIKPKSSYIIHVQDYFVGVGYYKEKSQ